MVTTLMKNAKRRRNYDKPGKNPRAKFLYRNLKSYRRQL